MMRRHGFTAMILFVVGLVSFNFVSSAGQAQDEDAVHPRLFFTADSIETLRERAQTTHAPIWEAIQRYVDSQLGTMPPEIAPTFGTEEQYRNFGNQPIAFAFACVIADEPRYCDLTKDYLMTYARWTQWDEPGRRDLGLAHMLFGTSLAYDWIYAYLSPEERLIIRDAIARWAHRMHQASADGYQEAWTNWWTNSFIQNHFSTNHSALGIAGMVLQGDTWNDSDSVDCTLIADGQVNTRWEPSTALDAAGKLNAGQEVAGRAQLYGDDGMLWFQLDMNDPVWVRADVVRAEGDCDRLPPPRWVQPDAWVERAAEQISLLTFLLDGIGDGTWHEGMNYQNYMLSVLVPFLYNYRELEGEDLFPHEYMQSYADWRLYNYLPGTIQHLLSTGDLEWWWGNSFNSHALLRFVASEYDDTNAQWLADQIVEIDGWGEGSFVTPWIVFEFLYFDPEVESESPERRPLAHVFPDLEGVIWRTGWTEDDVVFGLKTGSYGGRYNFHTFVTQMFPWNVSCAGEGCTFNTTHDHEDANSIYLWAGGDWIAPEEVGYGRHEARFHNTVLIDGTGQSLPQPGNSGAPDASLSTESYLQTTINATYYNYVESDATRRYPSISGLQEYVRSVLFVRPDYFLMVDNFVSSEPHTYEWISHSEGAATAADEWIRAESEGDNLLGIGVVAPDDFELTTETEVLTRIRLQGASPDDNARFITLLYPTTVDRWGSRPNFTTLVNTESEAAVRVQREADGARTDDVMFGFANGDANFDSGPYAHDMQVAAVSFRDPLRPDRLFAYGGTFITDQVTGITLVSNLHGSESFEAVYNGNTVSVTGNLISRVMLYAPGVEHVMVNGASVRFTRDGDFVSFGEDLPPESTEEATDQPDESSDTETAADSGDDTVANAEAMATIGAGTSQEPVDAATAPVTRDVPETEEAPTEEATGESVD